MDGGVRERLGSSGGRKPPTAIGRILREWQHFFGSTTLGMKSTSATQLPPPPPPILPAAAAAATISSSVTAIPAEVGRNGSSVLRDGEGAPAAVSSSPENKPEKMCITMEFGDEYNGEVKMDRGTAIPHGYGTLQSSSGMHCYVGGFVNRSRDGDGKLLTERYVLWSKWKLNRPDTTNQARIDYPDGSKYCGFLTWRQDNAAAQYPSRGPKIRHSKFSTWVQMNTPVRERWGELVGAKGDRYFGQWENNLPSGFGCLVTTGGDRYVGLFEEGKFHDTGTLFSLHYGRQNACHSLLDGATFAGLHEAHSRQATEMGEGNEKENEENDHAESILAMKGVEKERWGGVIFDGVWEKGRFVGEGYATLPCGTRIFAEWKSSTYPTNGRVFLGSFYNRSQAGMNARGWFQCFHWEPLLCGACEELKAQEYAACALYRERLHSATTQEEVQAVLADFCGNQGAVRNALKLFRRCFYFLHGTCGKSSEIGAGLCLNKLGWCYLRKTYGGCIHRRHGRPILVGDVDLAMTDIISFVRSVERWVVAMLGDAAVADNSSEIFVARRVLDYVLRDTHDVLLNLYLHAFKEEDASLFVALERLREQTTLDDMGVMFARQQSEEQLFDPYADAIHVIEQLERNVHTFTGKLRVLAQWSREIDLAARLAQVNLDDKSLSLLPRRQMHLESGSADDLLPIYQYVLIKARLRHLYVHAKLLVDLSSEDMFMEFTSPENFFVTTLHACTTILASLHPLLRDNCQILAPSSFFEEQLRSAIHSVKRRATHFLDVFSAQTSEICAVYDADELRDIAVGYLRAWLPETLDALSTWHCMQTEKNSVILKVSELLNSAMAKKFSHLHDRQCPRSVAIFCWLTAAHILSVLNLRLGILAASQTDEPAGVLLVEADAAVFLERYHRLDVQRKKGSRTGTDDALVLLLQEPLRPSLLNLAASVLLVAL
ncbi:protein kinase, putative [Trypanosoma cruzi marinkellei]|uniref:Protein kinase, putative n=1 Tax=Trypanosoma cruzi marinkellei TaxID=85056 RepID=K2N8G1_TRYCR|nr:protein kinase, putative [Trypanosoma cruzi marinkellei]